MFWHGVWFLLRMRGVNPQVYSSSAVREEREREKKNYYKENEFEPNLPEYLQEINLKNL